LAGKSSSQKVGLQKEAPKYESQVMYGPMGNYALSPSTKRGAESLDNFKKATEANSRSMLASMAIAVSEALDLAQDAPLMGVSIPTQDYGSYTRKKMAQFKGGKDDMAGASLRRFAENQKEEASKIEYDSDTVTGFLGELVPSTAGVAAAVLSSYVSAPVSLALGTVSTVGLTASSIGSGIEAYDEYKKEKGLEIDPAARLGVGLLFGAAEVITEKIQMDRFLPKGAAKGMLDTFLGSMPKEILEKEGLDLVKRFAQESVSNSKLVSDLITGTISEGSTELLTSVAQEISKYAYFEKDDRSNIFGEGFLADAMKSFLGGAVMGAGLGPLSYGSQKVNNNKRRKAAGEVFIGKDSETGDSVEIIGKEADNYIVIKSSGEQDVIPVSRIQGSEVSLSYNAFKNILNGSSAGTAMLSEDPDAPQVGESMSFGGSKAVITKVDPSSKTAEIKLPNGQKRTFSFDEYKKFKENTFEVELFNDGENDFEFASKNGTYQSIDQFESLIDANTVSAFLSLQNPSIEFEVKDFRTSPTAAPDFRIIGRTKPSAQTEQQATQEPGGAKPTTPQAPQAQPVDQGVDTQVPIEAPELANVEATEKALTGKNISAKVGAKEINDLNQSVYNRIVERQAELLKSGVKDFDSDAEIQNLKKQIELSEAILNNDARKVAEAYHEAKTSGKNPQLVQLVESLIKPSISATATVDTTTPEGVEVARKIARDAKAKSTAQSIEKAAATLKVSFPDVDMIVGEDDADTKAKMVQILTAKVGAEKAKELADGMDANGTAIFAGGKAIAVVINKSLANSRTAAHEVWHIVLRDAFGKNPKKFEQFRNEIANTLINSGYESLADELDTFASGYDGDITYEEYLAELGGYLATSGFDARKLNAKEKGLLAQIKEIINKFSMDLIGKKVFLENATPENILDFMMAISDMIARGEDVSPYIKAKGEGVVADGKDVKVDAVKQNTFDKGVEAVKKNAEEYKAKIGNKSRTNVGVPKLFGDVSKMMSKEYEKVKDLPNDPAVRASYEAMMDEVIDQYDFIVSKGLKVVKHTGKGEPYANSTEMLKDLKDNNTLKFLPNEVAFGQGDTDTTGNIGLEPSGRKLEDGYELTKSEAFRVVHDYFGHGILGNQFGPIGEENATLQHLDLFSDLAAPAVILQTRGQNSWVNFSGTNDEAAKLRSDARKLTKEGKTEEANKLLKKAEEIFKFAEPKIGVFPSKFNFKRYETARRLNEQKAIDSRTEKADNELSSLLEKYSAESRRTRGVNRRNIQETRKIGGFDLNTVAEYSFDEKINEGVLAAFPRFKGVQKVYEITDGDKYRQMMMDSLKDNPFASSVTVHSPEDFNQMRMFVTEDGSTGITITKEGFLGGAFSDPNAKRPNNLAQLMVLGIKEGATTAEAFDTVLPDYYSLFGFKAVSRTAFNDEYRPLVENGTTVIDWDYDTYKNFNGGRPDVVFFIYDGGNRNTIEDRLGLFDTYNYYDKQNTKAFDKDGYMDAEAVMKQEAVKRLEFDAEMEIEAVKQINPEDIRSKDRPGKRISKGLGVSTVNKKKVAVETDGLSIDYVKNNSPEIFISNAKLISEYLLVSGDFKGVKIDTVEDAQKVYDLFVRRVSDNLIYLVDEFKPEFREISTLWYDGANIMANDMAQKYGVKPEQVAGIMASLSPQKDWYQNVRLAEMVLMAYDTNPVVSQEMIDYQKKISNTGLNSGAKSPGNKLKVAKEEYKKSRTKANKKALDQAQAKFDKAVNTIDKLIESLGKQVGKKLKDVPAQFQPYMVRTYHEVNTTKDYNIVRPDGEYGGLAKKKDGKNAKVAWGSYTEVGKAVSIYNNGSQENITRSLGEKHKIRNFYNNIIDPMSPDGDVTIDTHAVAAGLLMALSGKAKQVSQNFGSGTSNSGPLGIQGTYYIFADAYALAAKEKGLLPRQIQSITWEAIRGLYKDTFKSDSANVKAINKIWERYANGEIEISEARELAKKRAGGIEDPTWAGGPLQEESRGGYESEVYGPGVDGNGQDIVGDVESVKQKPTVNVLAESDGLTIEEANEQGLMELLSSLDRETRKRIARARRTAGKAAKLKERDKATKALDDFMSAKEKVVKSIQGILKSKFVVGGKEVKISSVSVGRVNKILDQVLKGKSFKSRYKLDQGKNRIPRISSVEEAIQEAYKIIQQELRQQSVNRARSNRVVAKRNLKAGKLGVVPTGGSLDQMLAIDPKIIPLDVFEEYASILEMLGKRKAVLTLEEKGALSTRIENVMDAVNTENGLIEQLAIAYDNAPKELGKKKDPATGQIVTYESFSLTVDAMVKTGTITQKDADLMKRRRADIEQNSTSSKRFVPATRQQVDAEIQSILNKRSSIPSPGAGFTDRQNEILRLFASIKKSDLDQMIREVKDDKGNVIGYNAAELVMLSRVMDNLANNYITHLSQKMSERITQIRGAIKIESVFSNYKNNIFNFISKLKVAFKTFGEQGPKKTSIINEKIRRTGNYAIDIALNNFKNTDVYNTVLRPISVAIEKKNQELQNITAEITSIVDKIPKKDLFKENALARLISLHKMHLSDPTMPTVEEWFKATKKGDSQYLPESLDQIEALIKSASDASGFSLSMAESKQSPQGKKLLSLVEEISDKRLAEKTAFGATVIRGTRVPVLDYYAATPRVVRMASTEELEKTMSNYSQPSSRASTFYEKTKSAHEISFDIVESILWSARHTLTDYHITTPIRNAQGIVKELKRRDFKGSQKEALEALEITLKDSIEMVLMDQWGKISTSEKIGTFLTIKAYQATLGGIVRPVTEFATNLEYALIENSKETAEGIKVISVNTGPGVLSGAMFNLGSTHLNRVFSLTGQSSRYTDTKNSFSYDPIRQEVSNLKIFAGVIGGIGETLDYYSNASLSRPDQIVSRMVYFGALNTKFKELSKQDIDLKKVAENDQEYIQKHKELLDAASEYADMRVAEGFSSSNKFDGILRNQKLKSDKLLPVLYTNFNSFMNKFMVGEYVTFMKATHAMMGNGYLTRIEGLKLIAAQSARMATYSALMQYLGGGVYNAISNAILEQLGIDQPEEEEEDKENKESALNILAREGLTVVASLAIDRNFGNLAKVFTGIGTDYLNETFGKDITYKGTYNVYEDGISYPFIDLSKGRGELSTGEKAIVKISGPMSPYTKNFLSFLSANDTRLISRKDETKKKYEDKMVLFGAKTLFLMTGIPVYRDLNKITEDTMYKIQKDKAEANKKIKP
jgi:hypothetical protein